MSQQRIGVSEARARFSELLDRVRDEHAILTITRHRRPVARIVPVGLVAGAGHLADATGWLADDDPFFDAVHSAVRRRLSSA